MTNIPRDLTEYGPHDHEPPSVLAGLTPEERMQAVADIVRSALGIDKPEKSSPR